MPLPAAGADLRGLHGGGDARGREEAHSANKRVTVHAESSPSILRAVEAGVDSVEHGTHLTDEAAQAMKAAGTYYVPTISTVYNRVTNADKGVGRTGAATRCTGRATPPRPG